ncbi:MAG: ABC transporter permease [Gammaproteobacteria bacterium]
MSTGGKVGLISVLSCALESIRAAMSLAWRDLRASGRYLWVFWACLMLGVTLIAASGGLFRQVSAGLLSDTRALFGGDLRVDARSRLGDAELSWMRANGDVSLLIELRTMMLAGGRPQLVELQSVDERYPLYGVVELDPALRVAEAFALRDGAWGAALDPVLARRLGLDLGDRVSIGKLALEVRALIRRQPDRSLSADWRGPPVFIAAGALESSGLVVPGSRLEYEYRVKIDGNPTVWVEALARAFPNAEFEVQTFVERSGRIAEVLGQVASGLLLIGFSALFVGGLGVFNSVRTYLDSKLATIATLRALGLRQRPLAAIYLFQVLLLAGSAALAGALIGGLLAIVGTTAAAERLPIAAEAKHLIAPLGAAWVFGVLTAITFALPAIGRALSVSPAALFRGIDAAATATPARWWRWTAVCGLATATLVTVVLPQPLFGAGFFAVAVLVLVLLEAIVRAVRAGARRFGNHAALGRHFPLKLAVANLYRPQAPLRVTLLSLGSALTVLVASTVVVMALLKTIDDTIPARAPALVFYDVSAAQVDPLRSVANGAQSLEQLQLAPLVLGRMSHVGGESLRASTETGRALESRDEHKLTHRLGNIDGVRVRQGRWWPDDYTGLALVAFEDREADQLGLAIGDRLRFQVMDEVVEAELAVIYSQRGIGTRFWFEGIFSDGALDRFITRYVGTAYMDHDEAVDLESQIAQAMPNIITVRTERILREARAMLGRASMGLAVIAGVTLLASLLVLVSLIATSRTRQIYDATVLHTLGARIGDIRTSLSLEYALIAVLTSAFAIAAGSAVAGAVLHWRIGLDAHGVWWIGASVALAVSTASLGLGARTLLAALRLRPAELLRSSG